MNILDDISLCTGCGGRSCSDIAIADYWGINKVAPELDDNMGVSLARNPSLETSPKRYDIL